MSNIIFKQVFRFIGLVLLQVLVFQSVSLGGENFNYVNVIIFPIFILLLPIRTPHALLIFLGFLIGITVDLFYQTPGIHASASVFSAFVRPLVLANMEPRGGYNVNHSPTKRNFGFSWFLGYSSILMLCHLFFYFSVEAFTFVYIGQIIMRTVFSFFASMAFIILFQFILDPKD